MCQLGKPFNSLKGDEVKKFVLDGPEIAQYLTYNLEPNDIVLSLSKSLQLWYKIEKCLKIGYIEKDRVEYYGTDINNFEADIEAFYVCRITSFMTNKIVGDT